MAGINPDISTSSFKPLSLDEIMMVPLAKQQQENTSQLALDEFAALESNSLEADNSYVSGQIGAFKKEAGSLSDQLMERGVDASLVNKVRGLRNRKTNELSLTGKTGQASAAYNQFKTNEQNIMNRKDLSDAQKRAGLAEANKIYADAGGASAGAKYENYNGVAQVNLSDKALELVSKMSPEQKAGMLGDGVWYDKASGLYRDGTYKNSVLSADRIQRITYQALKNDPDVADYLAEVDRLGIGNSESLLFNASADAANIGQKSNTSETHTIIQDKIAQSLLNNNAMNEQQAVELIAFMDGKMNNVTPDSLETIESKIELYGSEVQKYKVYADERKSQLLASGMSEEDILKDEEYKRLNSTYLDKNISYKNSQQRMKNIYKKVDSKITPDDKAIFETQDLLDKYNGDAAKALLEEFGKKVSQDYLKKGFGRSEEAMANILLAKEVGVDMDKTNRSRGDLNTWAYTFEGARERRSDATEKYLEANPQAEYFTRLNGESTGKYYTTIGGWNKTQSENFSVGGSTLAYNGGTLDQNEDYKNLLVEGEIPEFRVEATDGYDDNGDAFNNVIITTSKGSTSVQVIDNLNNSAKTKIANELLKGDFRQRKMGTQMLADMNHMRAIKKSGMLWQDEGDIAVNNLFDSDNKKIASAHYTKQPAGDGTYYYQVTIDGVDINDGQPLYGEKQVSVALEKAIKEIQEQ